MSPANAGGRITVGCFEWDGSIAGDGDGRIDVQVVGCIGSQRLEYINGVAYVRFPGF